MYKTHNNFLHHVHVRVYLNIIQSHTFDRELFLYENAHNISIKHVPVRKKLHASLNLYQWTIPNIIIMQLSTS